MAVDPRTPVLVGVGQTQQRVEDPTAALEPIDLLAEAVHAADADTGARRSLLAAIDTVAVDRHALLEVPGPRRAARPAGRRVAAHDHHHDRRRQHAPDAREPAGGRRSRAASTTSCCSAAPSASTRAGGPGAAEPKAWLDWTDARRSAVRRASGATTGPGSSPYEMAHLALAPTQVYPLFETALRAAAGRGIDEHQELVVRALERASPRSRPENPHAWSRTPYTAEEIRTVSADEPDGDVPVPEADVRQHRRRPGRRAAALLVRGRPQAAGVPDDRLVFPLAGADAHDHYFFTERAVARRVARDRDRRRAPRSPPPGIGLDDVARFDLYSCFPAAVQIAMQSLGLAGPDGGRRPPADPHRRARLRRRARQQLLDARDRRRWSTRAGSDPGSVGARHRARLVRRPSTRSGSTRRRRPPTGFVAVDPARDPGRRSTRCPRREPAGVVDGEASSRRRRWCSSATASRASRCSPR